MNPTNDARIMETSWSPSQNQLLETKFYYAKVDNLLFYVKARRGVSYSPITTTGDDVKQVILDSEATLEDNSLEQFNKLQKFLDTPAR